MDIKISIIDICYANAAPIPKTLMVSLLHKWKTEWKCENWKMDQKAGEKCTPYRYRSLPDMFFFYVIRLLYERGINEDLFFMKNARIKHSPYYLLGNDTWTR